MDAFAQFDLDRLPRPERLALISQLWDSLDQEHLPVSAAQRLELDRRLETLDADRRESLTWDELKAEMEQRCP